MIILRHPLVAAICGCLILLCMSVLLTRDPSWAHVSFVRAVSERFPGINHVVNALENNGCSQGAIRARIVTSLLGLLITVAVIGAAIIYLRKYFAEIPVPRKAPFRTTTFLLVRLRAPVLAILAAAFYSYVWFFPGSLEKDRKIDCAHVLTEWHNFLEVTSLIGVSQYFSLLVLKDVVAVAKILARSGDK